MVAYYLLNDIDLSKIIIKNDEHSLKLVALYNAFKGEDRLRDDMDFMKFKLFAYKDVEVQSLDDHLDADDLVLKGLYDILKAEYLRELAHREDIGAKDPTVTLNDISVKLYSGSVTNSEKFPGLNELRASHPHLFKKDSPGRTKVITLMDHIEAELLNKVGHL